MEAAARFETKLKQRIAKQSHGGCLQSLKQSQINDHKIVTKKINKGHMEAVASFETITPPL